MRITNAAGKLHCLTREIRMRQRVYPRWVAEKRMSQSQADYEIETMQEIADDYRAFLKEQSPELKFDEITPGKFEQT